MIIAIMKERLMSNHRAIDIKGTVLLADDHQVVRIGVGQMLRSELGVKKVVEAERFDEAMKIIENQPIALAIFDLGMPGVDRPATLAVVRAKQPETKVVVLSASESRSDILAALEAGVHGYLVKAGRMEAIVDTLRYVMSGGIYVPPLLADRPYGHWPNDHIE